MELPLNGVDYVAAASDDQSPTRIPSLQRMLGNLVYKTGIQ